MIICYVFGANGLKACIDIWKIIIHRYVAERHLNAKYFGSESSQNLQILNDKFVQLSSD